MQSAIASAAAAIWRFLTASIPIPVWAIIIIAIAFIPTTVFLFRLLRKQRDPTWRDYREDMILGVKWRWTYEGNSIGDLNCFCPLDDTALVYSVTRDDWDDPDMTSFHCESCSREFGLEIGSECDVNQRVIRQIERKVRTGEWQNALPTKESAS